MNNKQIIIAIDGHSSCGKSTMAKQLASQLQYNYIDTGAMYRAVTLFSMRNELINKSIVNEERLIQALKNVNISFKFNELSGKSDTYLNGENVEDEIRQMAVSNNVSYIASIKEVRSKLVDLQQKMGSEKGVVMDGRDIGTVVFPKAELKIYMTASAEIRAKRRFDEMNEKGEKVSFDEVLENVIKRDQIDSNRIESPLKPADDAIILDNSNLTREEQLTFVLQKVNTIINAD